MNIYYFSGTGNTLYIVRELKKIMPEIKLIPVVSLLNHEGEIFSDSKSIGFCFPNHAGHLPILMKMFIKKLHLEVDEYLFGLCNSAFSKSLASLDIDKILKKKGCNLSTFFNLIMPDNHMIVCKNYEVPSKEVFIRCEEQVQKDINQVKAIITHQSVYHEQDKRPAPFPIWIDKILRPFMFYLIVNYPSTVLKDAFYSNSKCNGCGLCEKVCPANRITMEASSPTFDCNKTCYGCYACLNFCPVESLQTKSKWYNGRSYTANNGRYPHPYACANDIAK